MLWDTVRASVSRDIKHGCEQYGLRIGIAGENIVCIYLINTAKRRFSVQIVDLSCAFI